MPRRKVRFHQRIARSVAQYDAAVSWGVRTIITALLGIGGYLLAHVYEAADKVPWLVGTVAGIEKSQNEQGVSIQKIIDVLINGKEHRP